MHTWAIAVGVLLAAGSAGKAGDPTYRAELQKWRADREARLQADDGWLTVAGLFWLKDGPNRFGSAPDNDVVLPASVPGRAGVFDFRAGRTTVSLDPGVSGAIEGKPVVNGQELQPDSKDVVSFGRVTLQVIKRQDRFGVRMRDMDSKARREFKGLHWFPIKESYRVTARWVPYATPQVVPIANVLGCPSASRPASSSRRGTEPPPRERPEHGFGQRNARQRLQASGGHRHRRPSAPQIDYSLTPTGSSLPGQAPRAPLHAVDLFAEFGPRLAPPCGNWTAGFQQEGRG
jgi:hypothetical protein